MFAWFAFFRGAVPPDPAALEWLAAIAGVRESFIMTPPENPVAHPFPGGEPAPALVLQLHFPTIEQLEAATEGPLQDLADADRHPWHGGAAITQQAMLVRRFPVPDANFRTPPDHKPCSYLVHYPGRAADLNAWLKHYNSHHPGLMARFPGIRRIEIFTRLDWVTFLPWPKEEAMQRNKLMFDTAESLSASLLSPALRDMRADYHQFPKFEGGNVHYVLDTRIGAPTA